MNRRALVVVAVLLTTVVFLSSPAAADDLSLEAAVQLAERAITDDAARRELAGVTSVDGVAVDFTALLTGSPDEIDDRLRTIASLELTGAELDAPAAGRIAREVLAGDEYQETGVATNATPLDRFFAAIGRLIPDGVLEAMSSLTMWLIIGLGAIVAATVTALRQQRRRDSGRQSIGPTGSENDRAAPSVSDLEAQADAASERGDHATAVRLRFKAGAQWIASRGLIRREETTTAGQLARLVGSPTLTGIAADFDRIVYGGRAAVADDANRSMHGWRSIRQELGEQDG